MPKIFISYRRDDSLLHAGRIFDQLALRFDPKDIFMDFTIPTGGDFPQILRDAVQQCDVCLVIIGKQWGDMMHQRTQTGADDWVRFEVRMALDRHANKTCVVMPILVGGAIMPNRALLPTDVHKLLDLNGLSMRDTQRDFHNDIAQLVADIQAVTGASSSNNQPIKPPPPPPPKIDEFATFDSFHKAYNDQKWDEARHFLAQLRSAESLTNTISKALDYYEKELWDILNREALKKKREREYHALRLLSKGNKKTFRATFEDFQKDFPDYDPDPLGHLASRAYDLMPQPFDWIHIPAGKVTLITEDHWSDNYIPKGKGVTFDVPAFDIAKYPVTSAQFDVFVNHPDGYNNPKWWDYSDEAKIWRKDRPKMNSSYFDGADCPRESVSWYDSVAFCLWLSAMTDEKIMLPTEQQWQRAAIGDTQRIYPWGDEIDETYANFGGNIGRTTPVTQYPKGASPYGVMDMAGNVWEWCLTAYYTVNIKLIENNNCVLRGGSWNDPADFVRSAFRIWTAPSDVIDDVGFRCVRSHQ